MSSVDYSRLPLGKQTDYCDRYDPGLLVAVPRAQTRDFIAQDSPLPFHGEDSWTGYELSWLDSQGKPVAACCLIRYSALSPSIVESKSLKLYLNSLNQTAFSHPDIVRNTLQQDIGHCIGDSVTVELVAADQPADFLCIRPWQDDCLDSIDLPVGHYQVDAGLLHCSEQTGADCVVSHLLRSNCPVTGQPDWASVRIAYSGTIIERASLLRYLCSFRLHQGFHEQCIERIFCDIWQQCRPQQLSVEGRFTRRGGLDINPFRSSHPEQRALGWRQFRQ